MSDVVLTSHRWKNVVCIPSSKALAHRSIICAGLSGTPLENVRIRGELSDDLRVTFEAVAKFYCGSEVDLGESGSSLRFLVPVFAAFGRRMAFKGSARLAARPIAQLLSELRRHGAMISCDSLPFEISGRMVGGEFSLPGDVSSQFVTGLLLALPLTGEGGVIRVSSPLESRPYVDLTTQVLSEFGVNVESDVDCWRVMPSSRYCRHDGILEIEGDWSSAAFPMVAAAIGNEPMEISGLRQDSLQGDRRIVEILRQFGANVDFCNGSCVVAGGKLKAFGEIDVRDMPDIVPALAVLAGVSEGVTRFTHCGRLRLKESDRLETVRRMIEALGGRACVCGDTLEVSGVERYAGGVVDGCNDHRIVMAAAAATCAATAPVRILDAEAVSKSWANFWKDTGADNQ